MLADLPEPLRKQVYDYLEADNFRAAKEIHDDWLAKEPTPKWDRPHTSS